MADQDSPCYGCVGCSMRCTAGVRMSEFEFLRIVETLRSLDPDEVHRVLSQAKETHWFEGTYYTACLFLDLPTQLCLIYPARPLICRLFGTVRHLPCPLGRIPADLDANRILPDYHKQQLATFQQWMMGCKIFNFDDLLGVPGKGRKFEL